MHPRSAGFVAEWESDWSGWRTSLGMCFLAVSMLKAILLQTFVGLAYGEFQWHRTQTALSVPSTNVDGVAISGSYRRAHRTRVWPVVRAAEDIFDFPLVASLLKRHPNYRAHSFHSLSDSLSHMLMQTPVPWRAGSMNSVQENEFAVLSWANSSSL